MSHLYKEWQDLMREYTKEQRAFAEAHERYHKIYAHIKQQSNSVGQNNGEKQNDK
jgi:hypothetical protein